MTREEAIDIVRKNYPHVGVSSSQFETALRNLIPELRESEDEKMMNQLHSWMMEFGGAEEYAERVFQWLKGLLEKQKEQKPAEWSEEDERMIRCITNRIESDIQYGNELTKAYGNQEISWLKSLRSQLHWKPSEEQESVAERFARIVRANLSKIDKEVQQEFEHLYFEITGNKMYGGYHD